MKLNSKIWLYGFKIIVLTCDALWFVKSKRDLISIFRRFDNINDPLKRCIVLSEPYFFDFCKKEPGKS